MYYNIATKIGKYKIKIINYLSEKFLACQGCFCYNGDNFNLFLI